MGRHTLFTPSHVFSDESKVIGTHAEASLCRELRDLHDNPPDGMSDAERQEIAAELWRDHGIDVSESFSDEKDLTDAPS